jgi:transposase
VKLTHLLEIIATRPILDRKDLARRYQRSLRTIDRWQAQGKLPGAFRLPGKMWRPADIEAAEKAGAV